MRRTLRALLAIGLAGLLVKPAPVRAAITSIFTLPSGSNTYVQYNDSGYFGAEAAFTYNKTTDTLTVSSMTATWVSFSSANIAGVLLSTNGVSGIQSLSVSTLTLNGNSVRSIFGARTYTIPNVTSGNFVMSEGTQTINAVLSTPYISISTIQLNGADIRATFSSRTLTIPDPGTNASFVMTEGVRTINGLVNFGSAATFTDSVTATSSLTVTGVLQVSTHTSGSTPLLLKTESANRAISLRTNSTERLAVYDSSVTTQVPVYYPDGTALLPSIGFASDIDNGLTRTGTNIWNASAGGLSVATFTAAGVFIKGTTTNDDATIDQYGYYTSSACTSYPVATSTQLGDCGSIVLPPGDWDVSANTYWSANGATVVYVEAGIGTSAGNNSAGTVSGDSYGGSPPPTATYQVSIAIPPVRKSISAQTTYYLKGVSQYTVAVPRISGIIRARRVR